MAEIIIDSNSMESAKIILTDDFLVIKGNHYIIRDWYIKKTSANCSIKTQDILSMGVIKMRSKRMLMAFIISTMLIIIFGVSFDKISDSLRNMDKQIDKAENVLNFFGQGVSDINAEETFKMFLVDALPFVMGVLVIGSLITLHRYLFKGYKFFRVTAVGMSIAVETKYYQTENINYLINVWENR